MPLMPLALKHQVIAPVSKRCPSTSKTRRLILP